MEPIIIREIEQIQKSALELIKDAETADAITLLIGYLENKDFELYGQLILLSNSYTEARKKVILVGGSKEEENLARITYNIIQFVGNLKLNLFQTKVRFKKTTFLPQKSVVFIGAFFIVATLAYLYLIPPKVDKHKSDKTTVTIPTPTYMSSMQHDGFSLLFQVGNSNKIDTVTYPINTILVDLKGSLLRKYNLDTLKEYTTIYHHTGIKEVARWVLFVGSIPILESDELLSLHMFSEINKNIHYSVFRLKFIKETKLLANASTVEQTDQIRNNSYINKHSYGAKWAFASTIYDPNEHQQWSQFHGISISDVNLVSGVMISQNHDNLFPFFSENFLSDNPMGLISQNLDDSFPIFSEKFLSENPMILQIEKASANKKPTDRKKYQFDLYNEFGLKEENIIKILSDEENDSWILEKMKRLVQISQA